MLPNCLFATFKIRLRSMNTEHKKQIEENKRPDGLTSFATTLTPGPEIGPLGHIIEIHLKCTSNERVK